MNNKIIIVGAIVTVGAIILIVAGTKKETNTMNYNSIEKKGILEGLIAGIGSLFTLS